MAEELDMLFVPGANMDMVYINSYGYDMRQLDSEMPDAAKSFDEKNFLQNPTHRNVAAFQFEMFQLKLTQYIDALAHVLSTGTVDTFCGCSLSLRSNNCMSMNSDQACIKIGNDMLVK